MVSEYTDSATQRLSTVMPIVVVVVVVVVLVVLTVVHKHAIWCNTEDFTVKPSIKKNFYTQCHQKFRRWFPGISLVFTLTIKTVQTGSLIMKK
jgi:predicted PurR-regulated permease PerM